MNKSMMMLLFLAAVSVQVPGKVLLDRTWDFQSSADVVFAIKDTLSISVHFPDGIPDDRLIGYCHFQITVSDSNPGAKISGTSFVCLVQLNSGFNNFDHVLTIEMNYAAGLLVGNKSRNYGMYMDPYPVSKIHQLFAVAASNFTVDTSAGLLRAVYFHKKPVMAVPSVQKKAVLSNKLIATTGYPFDYVLFRADSDAVAFYPIQRKYTSGSNVNLPRPVRLYTINGRVAAPLYAGNRPASRLNDGMYIFQSSKKGHNKGTICTVVKK
jgi:hypothetical protein